MSPASITLPTGPPIPPSTTGVTHRDVAPHGARKPGRERSAHTHDADDPVCALILTHRRLGVAASRAAEGAVPGRAEVRLRSLLQELSEVALDAAVRLALHARSEGIPVGEALHLSVDEGGGDPASLLKSSGRRLIEQLAHTDDVAATIQCDSCARLIRRCRSATLPFAGPLDHRVGSQTDAAGEGPAGPATV